MTVKNSELCLVMFAVLALFPSSMSAQLLRGVVVDAESREPAHAILVTLIDSEGLTQMRFLSGVDGMFRFLVPRPGEYSVRAEGLGTTTSTLEGISVALDETVSVRIEVSVRPIMLEGIAVRSKSRCELARDSGADVQRVWDAARKVLAIQSFTDAEGWYRYDLVKYTRQLDPRSLTILDETSVRRHTTNQRPIISRPADVLLKDGYVVRDEQGMWSYAAPDADVLLSDGFLNTHCFALRAGSGEMAGLIGLEFRPQSRRRGLTDVEGVLWLERESGGLRWLEFGYRNLPAAADELDSQHVGGRVEFRGFEDGTWIVSNWRIRMPVITEEELAFFGGRRLRLARIVEEGGRVARAWRPASASAGYSDSDLLGTIDGEVSLYAPEYGSVLVMGVGKAEPVDASGRFHIEKLPAGRYRLAYVRPEMLGLDRTLVEAEVEVTAAGPNTVALAPRSKTAVLAEICGRDEWLVETAVLLGEVLDRRTGVAVTGAEVSAVWQRFTEVKLNAPVLVEGYEGSISTKTNEFGAFRICGVPNDRTIRVYAQLGTDSSREQQILIPSGQLVMSVVIDWEIEGGRYR